MFNALFTKTEEYAKLAQALGGPGLAPYLAFPGQGGRWSTPRFPRH